MTRVRVSQTVNLAFLAVASDVIIAHTQHKQLRYSVDKNYKENQLHQTKRFGIHSICTSSAVKEEGFLFFMYVNILLDLVKRLCSLRELSKILSSNTDSDGITKYMNTES